MNDSVNKHLSSAHYMSDSEVCLGKKSWTELGLSLAELAPFQAEEIVMWAQGLFSNTVNTQSFEYPGGSNQGKSDRNICTEPELEHINEVVVWFCSPS